MVEKVLDEFEKDVLPLMPSFAAGLVHNDGNHQNIIVQVVKQDGGGGGSKDNQEEDKAEDEAAKNFQVKSFIDFGDVCHTAYVNEAAITMAYCMLRKECPLALEAADAVLEGYNEILPLSLVEVDALPVLIKTRITTSVIMSAHTMLIHPEEEEYLTIDATPGWKLLEALRTFPTDDLRSRFRRVCGLMPDPHLK
jgi:hydroxylysine kinase